MINCVGGLSVLIPILEQLSLTTSEQQDPTAGSDFITPDVVTPADEDWVILPSNRASGLLFLTLYSQCNIEHAHIEKEMIWLLFVYLILRNTPGEEPGGHISFGAETFPTETSNQPGESSPLSWCQYTGSSTA